jgi:hypothetical protein
MGISTNQQRIIYMFLQGVKDWQWNQENDKIIMLYVSFGGPNAVYIYILQYSFLNIIFVDGGVACDINSSVLVAYRNTGFI